MPQCYVWSKLSAAQWEDAWEERFRAMPDTVLVINPLPKGKSIRVEIYCQHLKDAEHIKKEYGGSIRPIKEQNWAVVATPKIEPIKIRQRFLIVSETDEKILAELRQQHPKREFIFIPIEMAFGTGDHPTTATCLRLMCDLPLEGARVLDLGCGTGILSIAASKLGAQKILGVDFDPEAVAVSKINAVRNLTTNITFQTRDVLKWSHAQTYDLILANIFADVLTASFPKMHAWLRPGGTLILSGILNKHAPDLITEGKKAGFHFTQTITKGKWVTLSAVRKK
jgi:ribosomal protein L11 methyltransferase